VVFGQLQLAVAVRSPHHRDVAPDAAERRANDPASYGGRACSRVARTLQDQAGTLFQACRGLQMHPPR
jgi:hypothetical protein